MGKIKRYKNVVEKFLSGEKGQRFFNFAYRSRNFKRCECATPGKCLLFYHFDVVGDVDAYQLLAVEKHTC